MPCAHNRSGEVNLDVHPRERERERVTQHGILLSEKGTKPERMTDVAATLMARDYKGFGNQAMTGVVEVKEGRKGEIPLQHFQEEDAESDGLRQFRLESDPVCGNGSRQHDAVHRGNGMQGYRVTDTDGVNPTVTANGGGLAKYGGGLIVEKFDG